MGELLNQFMIAVRIIIRSIRQFLIHSLNTGLQVKDMFKSHLSLFHHGMLVTQDHDLRQIANGHITRNRDDTRGRSLYPCQYFKHGRFTSPVLSNQRNAVSLINDV